MSNSKLLEYLKLNSEKISFSDKNMYYHNTSPNIDNEGNSIILK